MLTQMNDPVHPIRPCYVRKKKALFHRWIEMTFPKGSSFFHQTLAIVEFEDGHIEQVRPKSIVFADGGHFNDITWKELNDDGDGMEEVRNEMNELKPCPFCGRKPELRHDDDGFSYIVCANDNCYVRTDGHLNDNAAIKAWNRRVGEQMPEPWKGEVNE